MKIIPIGNRVILEQIEKESKTSSGIYIPTSSSEIDNVGKVIAVGDVKNVKVGDTVVYAKFSSTEVTSRTKKFLIVEEKDILGIVREE